MAGVLAVSLAACSSAPPAKPWQVRSLAASELAEAAWLDGAERVAAHEWDKARQQIARTGQPQALAQLELRRCAVLAASLDWQPCAAFGPLAPASGEAARAYAAYLQGQHLGSAQRGLLPPAQQGPAALDAVDARAVATLQAVPEPLSRLLAIALLARRSGQMPPELMQLAIDTASEQGWRRPLLAWLLRQQSHAQTHGLADLLEQTRLRLAIVQGELGQADAAPKAANAPKAP
ncbi:MAG: hypothetical protein Q4A98_02390 [Comamonadaceae bacterium]|nr:hypothetical protein [Comamonadaceae bacterium]